MRQGRRTETSIRERRHVSVPGNEICPERCLWHFRQDSLQTPWYQLLIPSQPPQEPTNRFVERDPDLVPRRVGPKKNPEESRRNEQSIGSLPRPSSPLDPRFAEVALEVKGHQLSESSQDASHTHQFRHDVIRPSIVLEVDAECGLFSCEGSRSPFGRKWRTSDRGDAVNNGSGGAAAVAFEDGRRSLNGLVFPLGGVVERPGGNQAKVGSASEPTGHLRRSRMTHELRLMAGQRFAGQAPNAQRGKTSERRGEGGRGKTQNQAGGGGAFMACRGPLEEKEDEKTRPKRATRRIGSKSSSNL